MSEVGKYIYFEINPVAAFGVINGISARSDTVFIENTPPQASNISITGVFQLGKILQGHYTYSDPENDTESMSIYRWYRANTADGLGKTLINGANSTTYVVQSIDMNKYLSFEVVPVAVSGSLTGIASAGIFSGPVLNSAPTASSVSIIGTQAVCKALTGQYTYNDTEGDLENGSLFRWLRANTASGTKTPIDGANGKTYTLTKEDQGKYIFFEVKPIAESGVIEGISTLSNSTGAILNLLPNVSFNGGTTVCEGQSANLTLNFSGTPPFTFTYTNGSKNFVLNTSQYTYNLVVQEQGTYKGYSLLDNLNCLVVENELTSTATVNVTQLPEVQIFGLNTAYSVNGSPVSLSGTPAGGTFTGPGVVTSTKTFYPSIAGVDNSPHAIVYSYTLTPSMCTNTDTVFVSVFNANALISGLRQDSKYCTYDNPFLITGVNLKNAIGLFSISGGIALTNHNDNTATIYPNLLAPGTYTISYVYFDNVYQTIIASFSVEQVEKAQILGLSDLDYCENEKAVKLIGNYASGVFSGNGITKDIIGGYYYEPYKSMVGNNKIFYRYYTSYGCVSSDSVVLSTLATPQLQFDITNKCWKNDTSQFINLSQQKESIVLWEWNFGDNSVAADKNKSTFLSPKHFYSFSGNKIVKLLAQNLAGCRDTIQKTIHLGNYPQIDFKWDKECFVENTEIQFSNLTASLDPIKSYNWYIQDTLIASKDFSFIFNEMDNYEVKLVTTTSYNCSDSSSKVISLRPIFSIKDSVYSTDFENGNNIWYTNKDNGSFWNWATPGGSQIFGAHSGSKALYTKFESVRQNRQIEASSLCFDFTEVKRPYIELWINSDASQNLEGAALQYSIDGLGIWNTIGSLSSGVNWYSGSSIASLPGNQPFGWTGNSGTWVQSRHNLDSLNGENNIKFRIVYGENASSSLKDGFAIDDIFIGQRTKTVLFEHFTNYNNLAAETANDELFNIVEKAGVDALSIQYHAYIPGKTDTLNLDNQSDPNARAARYGFTTVPVSCMDGGAEAKYIYNYTNKFPSLADINIHSLLDPVFDIEISSTYKVPKIEGNVKIKALNSFLGHSVLIYIAVVEDIAIQSQTSTKIYHNVLKKLLPTTGYFLAQNWAAGQTADIPFNWEHNTEVYDVKNVKIVAFVQDYVTKEVYQSKLTLTVPITGIPIIKEGILTAKVYPNPATDKFYLSFGSKLASQSQINIYNDKGSIVQSYTVLPGISLFELDVANLPNGTYLLHLIRSRNLVETLKLVVIH